MTRRRKALILIGACVTVTAGWFASGSLRGFVMARYDLARGHVEVKSCGLPDLWQPQYFALLKERYGIEHRVVAGCVVSSTLAAYVDTYFEVVETELSARYGRNIFDECAEDAAEQYKREHPELGRHEAEQARPDNGG